MRTLEIPIKRHTSGAFPKYSLTENLSENFVNLDPFALRFILQKEGYLTEAGKPTQKSGDTNLVSVCDGKALWDLKRLEGILQGLGNSVQRSAVNQELSEPSGSEPQWVNLGTVGTYFSVSANEIGKWLDELSLRDNKGMATNRAIERGLATTFDMSSGPGKNSTRRINHWNLFEVKKLLVENGHYLNFDYERSLKGSGKNSNVKVETIDDRAKIFAKEFVRIFKDKEARKTLPEIVRKTPKIVQEKAENLIQKPGFISKGVYLKHLDRE